MSGAEKGKTTGYRKKQAMIDMLARGEMQKDIAEKFGVDHAIVSRFKKANKEQIEAQAQRYLDALPDIVAHDLAEIEDYYEISGKLREALKAGGSSSIDTAALQKYCEYIDKRITDIKRSIGLYAAHSPSLVFRQLNIYGKDHAELNPIIRGILGGGGDETNQIDYDEVGEVESS